MNFLRVLFVLFGCFVTFDVFCLLRSRESRMLLLFHLKEGEVANSSRNATSIQQRIDAIPGMGRDEAVDAANNKKSKSVVTIRGKQGFHLPQDLLDWTLPTLSGRNFSKTVCHTNPTEGGGFAYTVVEMFDGYKGSHGWKGIHDNTTNPRCNDSRVRVPWGAEAKMTPTLEAHAVGEQLTLRIFGSFVLKEKLAKLIQNQPEPPNGKDVWLKDSIPTTRHFKSTESCKDFCDGEWLTSQNQESQPQKWIWKPKRQLGGGKQIVQIGVPSIDGSTSSLESCHDHCSIQGGETLMAQEFANAMLLPDGRKFDIRSCILVANVDPLVVFTGAEYVRICAEPMNATNPTPFPGLPANSSWNPFQQVCNSGMGRKHPTPGVWSPENNNGPLGRGISDEAVQSRVLSDLDNHNVAIIKLIRNRFKGSVGMFQTLAIDYLVDTSERIWVLELNPIQGLANVGVNSPNPFGDVFKIEWAILEAYNQHKLDPNWETILYQRLTTLELETLRMIPRHRWAAF